MAIYQPLTGNFSALRPFGVSWMTMRGGPTPGIKTPVRAVTVCMIYGDNERPLAMGFAYCSASDKFSREEAEQLSFKQVVSGPHGDPAVLRRIGKVFTKAERHALREAMWKVRNPEGWEKEMGNTNPDISYAPTGILVGQQGKLNVREEDQGF